VLKKKKSKVTGQPRFKAGSVISNTCGMLNHQLEDHCFAKAWDAPQKFFSIMESLPLFSSSKSE